MIDSVKIGEGITIGVKSTITAPDGQKVKAFAVKLVPGGVALGCQTVDAKGKTTEYAATVDREAVMELGSALVMAAFRARLWLAK